MCQKPQVSLFRMLRSAFLLLRHVDQGCSIKRKNPVKCNGIKIMPKGQTRVCFLGDTVYQLGKEKQPSKEENMKNNAHPVLCVIGITIHNNGLNNY